MDMQKFFRNGTGVEKSMSAHLCCVYVMYLTMMIGVP